MEPSSARKEIDALYPGRWALLLTPLCAPEPHQHRGKGCPSPGKRPLDSNWNAEAVARMEAGRDRDREQHVACLVQYIAQGGNVGLVLPDEVVAIDADTPEAVAWCDKAMPDAPMQNTAKGGHFLVRVPPDAGIPATVSVEIAPDIKVDVRAPGRSQIAVEPSVHFTGAAYSWRRSLPSTRSEFPECPWPILEAITNPTSGARSNGTRSGAKRVEKGGRNDYLYKIGCGMRGRGLSSGEILAELQRENAQHCRPPLDEGEVACIAESVLKYPAGSEDTSLNKAEVTRLAALGSEEYEAERKPAAKALGYRVSALDEMVASRRKEMAKPPAKEDPKEGEKIRGQVPELALDKNILARLEDALSVMGVVGERIVAVLVFLMATARILDVKCPGGAAVKGPSSSGKSYVSSAVLRLFPPEVMLTLTAMSQKALVYLQPGALQHKVLNIAEATVLAERKGEENLAALFVRSLLSEGRIDYAVPMRNEDGTITSLMIEQEGPASLIVTTTKASLDAELETRLLSVLSDDTSEHTAHINLATGLRFAGVVSELDPKPWHDLQKWLQAHTPLKVVVPYAKELAGLLPTAEIRARRDTERLLILTCAHAALHLHHREQDEDGRVVAALEDYEAVRHHLGGLFAQAAGQSVHISIRDTVEAVRELKVTEETEVTISKIAEKLKLAPTTIRSRVAKALEAGFLVNEEERRGRAAKLSLGERELPQATTEGALPTCDALETALRDEATNLGTRGDEGGFVAGSAGKGNGKYLRDDGTTGFGGVGEEEEDGADAHDPLSSVPPPEMRRRVVAQDVSSENPKGSGDEGGFVAPSSPFVASSPVADSWDWTLERVEGLVSEVVHLGLFLRQDGETLQVQDGEGSSAVDRLPAGLLAELQRRAPEVLSHIADLGPPTPAPLECFD